MMLRTPVLVVGGGPVGLALAMELDLHGIDCVIVEPRTDVSHARPRAKTTTARTMELFRRWGFADEIRSKASIPVAWSSDIVFCTTVTGREISRFTETLGLGLTGSALTAEAGQQVTQPVVEQALRDRLASSEHADARFGWRATSVDDSGSSVVVTIRSDEGETETIEADYVVGADGARSIIRKAMGAEYIGETTGRPNLNITFRSNELGALIPHGNAIHYWVLNHASPGVVGPLDLDGTWWAISTGRPEQDADRDPFAIVRALVGADIDVQIIETDPWQARSLVSDRYRNGRLFVVGDAAHQNPPWGGHGFNTGVGDAVNLGWKLSAVLQGWAPVELLDSYESERRPISEQTIAIARQNTNTLPSDFQVPALMGSDDEFAVAQTEVSARIQLAKRIEFHSLGLVLGYNYGPSSAIAEPTVYSPTAAPGHRLPHSWIDTGLSIYDLLGPDMSILGDGGPLAEEFARRGAPVTYVARVDTQALFGVDAVIVRPDQHIAWLGPTPDSDDVTAIVDAVLAGRWPALALS